MKNIQSIERALQVLEALSLSSEPVRLNDLAETCDLHPATCARVVQTLVGLGYASQVGRMSGYVPGPMVHVIASRSSGRPDLVHVLRPHLENLASAVRETAVLASLVRGRRISLLEIEGDQELVVRSHAGQRFNPYDSVTGRVLLAYADEAARKEIIGSWGLPGNAWPEVNGASGLEEVLAEIRLLGNHERPGANGTVGVAFPIQVASRVELALGICVPAVRFDSEHRDRIYREMAQTAAAMSRLLNVQNTVGSGAGSGTAE